MAERERKSGRIGGTSGFTLIELLVALAILAGVAVGLREVVGSVASVAGRESDRAERALRGEAARVRLGRLFRAAYAGPELEGSGFDGSPLRTPGGSRDRVRWVALDAGMASHPEADAVRLTLETRTRDGRREILILEYEVLAQGGTLERVGTELPAAGVRIRYHATGRRLPAAAWRSDLELPTGIELAFEKADGDPGIEPLTLLLWIGR